MRAGHEARMLSTFLKSVVLNLNIILGLL